MGAPQRCLCAELSLGGAGGAHGVRLRLAPTALEVEVEALDTAQRWRGRFDAAAVEELTRRTGNFKRFGVFCAMLEAALLESSPSVSLELLTFGDLQALRCRGGGGKGDGPPRGPPRAPPHPHPGPASPGLGAKRYLLLVYCVEFDRIHYPLPLPPAPPQDPDPPPEALRRLVRTLRDELRRARAEARGLEAERLREEARRRRLEEELREAQEAVGSLRARVRALTAELAATRGRRTPPAGPPPRDPPRRSGSRDSSRGRHRTPSPAGPRAPRFDPTAFVRARERRRREAELQKQRRAAAPSGGSPRGGRGRSSSAESLRSHHSGSEAEPRGSGKGGARSRRPLSSSAWNSPGEAPRGRKQPPGSGAGARREKENVAELWDIDARLQALQECLGALHARQ